MIVTYLGHSTFSLKGAKGTVVTDPFGAYVGFGMPTASADIITVSHDHPDHNNTGQVNKTARRDKPFVISHAGQYEVGEISVFGVKTFHDEVKGTERGENIVYTILIDELKVCHLGDLGHELDAEQLEAIGEVDILLCPVGGEFTIDPQTALKVIRSLEPSIIIPMHYKTPRHDEKLFGELKTIQDFALVYGSEVAAVKKFEITRDNLPEETELVIMSEQG